MQKVTWVCDRCGTDIVVDARYSVGLQFIYQEGKPYSSEPNRSMDVCGYCAGLVRKLLDERGDPS